MKTKNRDQSLSDSRELDGSYDQLTGKFGTLFCKTIKHAVCQKGLHLAYLSIYDQKSFAKHFAQWTAYFVVSTHLAREHAQSYVDVFYLKAFLFADLASYHSLMVLTPVNMFVAYELVTISALNGGRSFHIHQMHRMCGQHSRGWR